jgi:NAD(P) transhydrogenase
MIERKVDVVVIGSGPGGEGAAMQLAKGGRNVVLVERSEEIGGGCTHRGTIPSKALRWSIRQLTEALKNPLLSPYVRYSEIKMEELRRSALSVIAKQESMRRGFYARNNVEVIFGHARFCEPNKIQIDGKQIVQADQFVIATGSRPYRPDEFRFDEGRIFDSDTILNMRDRPQSMTVYGAGVVGCEYASMFRNLDIKINLVNSRDRLLDFLDDEITDALSYHMRDSGIVIRHNEMYEKIETTLDGVIVHLKSGKQLKTDVLLWAVGRTGNTDTLGIEHVGLHADSRGYLSVNEYFQTEIDHVYAVGDVVGFPSLASAAYTQGRAAGNHILGNIDECRALGDIPSGIYTSPEISSVGKTERQLTEAKIPYEVGSAKFKSLAKAQIINSGVGMLKLLFHRETLEILGVHCFGENASEIIHIGQAIMEQSGSANTLKYFINTTFNYPTMAEAYRVAALNGYNRLF